MKRSTHRLEVAVLVTGLVAAPLGTSAQTMNGQSQMTSPMTHHSSGRMMSRSPSAADEAFMRTAAEINHGEIQGGMLAQQRGTTPGVRNVAKRYVGDHTANEQQLSALASRLGIALPPASQVTPDDKKASAKLEALHGRAFDVTYVSVERQGHESAIAAYRREAGSGSSPAVVAYAKRSLPTLEEHLALATQVAKGMSGMTSATH